MNFNVDGTVDDVSEVLGLVQGVVGAGELEVPHQGLELIIFYFPVKVSEGEGRVDEVVDAVADPGAGPAAVSFILLLHVVDLQEMIDKVCQKDEVQC